MSEKTITYILGAGASYPTLPLMAGLNKSLGDFFKKMEGPLRLEEEPFDPVYDIKINKRQLQERFVTDLSDLIERVGKHATIDTYAKKLYITGEHFLLRKLKAVFDCFLTLEQLGQNPHMRYDTFFASILEHNVRAQPILPQNIKILSWNYDVQLELAAGPFFKTDSVNELANRLNIFPRKYADSYNDGFSVYKLNGSCATSTYTKGMGDKEIIKHEFNPILIGTHIKPENYKEFVAYQLMVYHYNSFPATDATSLIQFAWEEEAKPVRKMAMKDTGDTDILVVVGYSFPTFNRQVDRELLENMKGLQKVIVQVPEPYDKEIIQRLRALREWPQSTVIESRPQTDEFFIPFEFH